MRIGKVFSKIFGNKSRVIIARKYVEYPLHEGRAIVQPEVPFWLKQKGILLPVSTKTREEFLKNCKDVFTHEPKRP